MSKKTKAASAKGRPRKSLGPAKTVKPSESSRRAIRSNSRPGAALEPAASSKAALSPVSTASFEEAKRAAIDSLVAAIEDAERRLLAIKRATSHAQLKRAGQVAV
jgi:hypothetical protein